MRLLQILKSWAQRRSATRPSQPLVGDNMHLMRDIGLEWHEVAGHVTWATALPRVPAAAIVPFSKSGLGRADDTLERAFR